MLLNVIKMTLFLKFKRILSPWYHLLKDGFPLQETINLQARIVRGKKTKLLGSHHLSQTKIGDYTYISQNAHISYTNIGKFCSIGPNLVCGWGIHPTNGISTAPMFYSSRKQNGYTLCQESKIEERKYITIGNDVFIGANVTILDGVTIGDGAIIGAGAVVSKDIPPYAIAVGCPIQIKKYRFNEDIIKELLAIQWWNLPEKYLSLVEKYFYDPEKFIEITKNIIQYNS